MSPGGRRGTALYRTALQRTPRHCTTLHRTVLYRTALYRAAPHCTGPHCTAPHYTVLHRTVPHRTPPHRTALPCTALHCTALHRTVPHRIVPHRTLPHCTLVASSGSTMMSTSDRSRVGSLSSCIMIITHVKRHMSSNGTSRRSHETNYRKDITIIGISCLKSYQYTVSDKKNETPQL